jgi:O-succinylbenzoate synthase
MQIRKIELFSINMPLKFVFHTSQTSFKQRETMIIKMTDELGNNGYGEVVAFPEGFYTKETLAKAKAKLINNYIPKLVYLDISNPFQIHDIFDSRYPMTIAGMENAMLDLYARRRHLPLMEIVFHEKTNSTIEAGMVLGDLDTVNLIQKIKKYKNEGYLRFKIKIKAEDGAHKLSSIREKYPDIKLLADANRSYRIEQIKEIKQLDPLQLLCIEEPLNFFDIQSYQLLQKELETPICLDESIHRVEDFKAAIKHNAFRVVNIKAGRVGGMYYAKKMIELCREHHLQYWIGSMVESGVSKILHVHLASLEDTYIPGDLSASSRYFEKDIIRPEIVVVDGKIRVPQGEGLGVDIDESLIKRYMKDYFKIGDR